MRPSRLLLLVSASALFFSGTAFAEGYNAGDACTAAGTMHTKNDTDSTYHLVCNGTIWVLSTTFEKSGEVGIGTTTPGALLSVGATSTAQFQVSSAGNGYFNNGTSETFINTSGITIRPSGIGNDGSSVLIKAPINLTQTRAFTLDQPNALINIQAGPGDAGGGISRGSATGVTYFYSGNNYLGSSAVSLQTNATDRLYITHAGNVGIGDTSPDHRLDVAGNIGLNASSYINFGDTDGTTGYGLRDNGGTVECKNSGGAWAACAAGGSPGGANTQIQFNDSSAFGGDADFTWDKTGNALTVTGDINYTGLITDTSDRRMKENIHALPLNQLQNILRLQPVSFTMKGNDRIELGLIAQDVEPVFPSLVKTMPDGTKTMNYIGLISPMAQAIKEQQDQIEKLQARLESLESGLCATRKLPPPAQREFNH